jgi:ankyrin repeat protein
MSTSPVGTLKSSKLFNSRLDIIEQRVIESVQSGDLDGILAVISDAESTLNAYRQRDGSTLLHLCAISAPFNLVKTILVSVDPNIQSFDGSTALHLASAAGRLSVVEALLETPNIDDTIKDNVGRTAVDVARSKPVETAFKFAQSKFVESILTSMHQAVSKGDIKTLQSCMASKRAKSLVDINAVNQAGDTILHRAVKGGKINVIKACLSLGADAFAKNRKGKMPIEMTSSDEIKRLLKEGIITIRR